MTNDTIDVGLEKIKKKLFIPLYIYIYMYVDFKLWETKDLVCVTREGVNQESLKQINVMQVGRKLLRKLHWWLSISSEGCVGQERLGNQLKPVTANHRA